MNGSTDPLEMLTVSNDTVELEEQLTRKNDGWVISLSLSSKVDETPVGVKVSLPLPNEASMIETGFHPRHEPHDWDIQDNVLHFEDTVPANDSLLILLGIVVLGEEDVTLTLPEATIEVSQPIDTDETGGDFLAEDVPLFRSSSMKSPRSSDVGLNEDESAVQPDKSSVLDGSDPESRPESNEASIFSGNSDPASDSPMEETSSEAVPFDEGEFDLSEDSPFNMEQLEESNETVDTDSGEEDLLEDGSESTDMDPGGNELGDVLSPIESGESLEEDPDQSVAESTAMDLDSEESIDVLSRLAQQLEAENPDSDALSTLRERLAPGSSRAVEVKLQHIQSRMDDLAAYTDALEGFINEHGTASDFMSDIHGSFEEIRTDVDEIRRETHAARNDRQTLREQLETVEESLTDLDDDLRSRTENVYDDLDSIHATLEEHDTEISTVEESVQQVDEEFESVREMIESSEAELEARMDDVVGEMEATEEELQNHRESIDRRLTDLSNEINQVRANLDSDLRDLENDVAELAEMREVFSQAFADRETED